MLFTFENIMDCMLFTFENIMDCMLFTFENKSSAHALGASMEWHFSFNKTEAAIFLMQTMLP